MRNGKGVGDVLEGERTPEPVPDMAIILRHPFHRDPFEGHGEEHREIVPVGPVKGEVLAENLHARFGEEALRGIKIGVIRFPDGADRETETVRDAGKSGKSLVKEVFPRIAVGPPLAYEVVLGGDLEEIDLGAVGEGLAMDAEAVGKSDPVGIAVQIVG